MLVRFVAFTARTSTHATCVQYLKGIKSFYKDKGLTDVGVPECNRALYRVLKGVKRSRADGVLRKCAITPRMLQRYVASLQGRQPFAAALVSACLVAFFGFFRKSNVATPLDAPHSTSHCIRVMDVEVLEREYALCISVRRTKTLQFGERVLKVHIAGFAVNPLDPVAAWQSHMPHVTCA